MSLFKDIVKEIIYESLLNEDKRTNQAKERCLMIIAKYFNKNFYKINSGEDLFFLEGKFKKFMDKFYHAPEVRKSQIMRLAPLFCRLAFDAGFGSDAPDYKIIDRLCDIIKYLYDMVKAGSIKTDNINIDTTTFDELDNTFGRAIDELRSKKSENNNTQYEINNDYEIIGPIDYETANEYGNYSCPDSKLCYTQNDGVWDDWTQGGIRSCYVILKKGWENIAPEHDDESENAYDTYGLSMIFVFVSPEGDLVKSNTRWNHRANYNLENLSCDNAFNETMISELVGIPFEAVFKPFTEEELELKGIIPFSKVQNYLDRGDFYQFEIDDYNINNSNGLNIIRYNGKCNLINKNNKLLYPRFWFDNIGFLIEGYSIVSKLNENDELMYNYLDSNGKFINPNKWFEYLDSFTEGFAKVCFNENGKYVYNFITPDGEVFFKEFNFDGCNDFSEGRAVVRKNNKYNFLDKGGYIVFKEGFDGASNFYLGYSKVKVEGKGYNVINLDYQVVLDDCYDDVYYFRNGFIKVKRGDKYNYCNENGKLISPNLWFDGCEDFKCNVGLVRIGAEEKRRRNRSHERMTHDQPNPKYNYIKGDGELLWDYPLEEWFDYAYSFHLGYGIIKIKDKGRNFINKDGYIVSPNLWFGWTEYVSGDGFVAYCTTEDGELYSLKVNGQLLNSNGDVINENKYMERKIKLTESDLHKIIKKSVKKILRENTEQYSNEIRKYIEKLLNDNNIDYNNYWIFKNAKENIIINPNGEWKVIIKGIFSYTVYEYEETNSYCDSKKLFEKTFSSIEDAIMSLVEDYDMLIKKCIDFSETYYGENGCFCNLNFRLYNDNKLVADSDYELKNKRNHFKSGKEGDNDYSWNLFNRNKPNFKNKEQQMNDMFNERNRELGYNK